MPMMLVVTMTMMMIMTMMVMMLRMTMPMTALALTLVVAAADWMEKVVIARMKHDFGSTQKCLLGFDTKQLSTFASNEIPGTSHQTKRANPTTS